MSEALEEMFLFGEEKMEKAVSQMKREFASVRTGRANPGILDKVIVEYYGAPTPIRQMAQVSVSEGTTLVITPFDKSIIKELEKAIIKAEIGVAPNNDGSCVRLNFPPLTVLNVVSCFPLRRIRHSVSFSEAILKERS